MSEKYLPSSHMKLRLFTLVRPLITTYAFHTTLFTDGIGILHERKIGEFL